MLMVVRTILDAKLLRITCQRKAQAGREPRAAAVPTYYAPGTRLRAAAAGVVLVLAAAVAPDGPRVLAQPGGADLRFAVPVRGPGAPDSPVLARNGHTWLVTATSFRLPQTQSPLPSVYPGMTGIRAELFGSTGAYRLAPWPNPL